MLHKRDIHLKKSIIFLGGIFPPSQSEFINRESKGVVQSAADALQKSLIKGLATHDRNIVVVNLPFVGSYPRLFRMRAFPPVVDTFDGVPLVGEGFPLRKPIKSIFRTLGAFRGIGRIKAEGRVVIIVYSAHLPFLLAALARRAFSRNVEICLVLPDFPEFMAEGGRLYRLAKYVETKIFNRLVKHIDYFVVLTEAMADRMRLAPDRYVVVEGIAEELRDLKLKEVEPHKRIFMYAGTLASRYGIIDLISAFEKVRLKQAELWICGEGDSTDAVRAAANRDHRIKFFGQVPREEAKRLQSAATILVNPRTAEGEFTKYSFPSKTMEYMASGRPVLMYRLPGVPDEYHDHFISPPDSTRQSMTLTMENLASWSDDDLIAFGRRAQEFVLENKNAKVQTAKILQMIDRGT